MKLIYILPSLCLTLLTSHADETLNKTNTPDPDPILTVDKVAVPPPRQIFNAIKDEPFWILHSYQADMLM